MLPSDQVARLSCVGISAYPLARAVLPKLIGGEKIEASLPPPLGFSSLLRNLLFPWHALRPTSGSCQREEGIRSALRPTDLPDLILISSSPSKNSRERVLKIVLGLRGEGAPDTPPGNREPIAPW